VKEYCNNKDHKNDPDWSYTTDGCPYCRIEELEQQLAEYKDRLVIKDDALTASMMIAEFTAAESIKLAEAILSAHRNIAAGSGPIADGEVYCVCSICKLARTITEGGS